MTTIIHGLVKSYTHKGCRCEECVAANRLRSREWRAKNPRVVALQNERKRLYMRDRRAQERARETG